MTNTTGITPWFIPSYEPFDFKESHKKSREVRRVRGSSLREMKTRRMPYPRRQEIIINVNK